MPPRGRYQQKQWAMREDAILDALADLSKAHGFANVTMDDLAEAVGISKATLYQHFSSKDEMLAALIHQHTARFIDWLASTEGQPPVVRLRETVRYLMQGHITPLRGLIQVGREDVIPVYEANTELVAQHAQTLEMLAAIIRQGQTAGTIAPDLHPQVIIHTMWALGNLVMGNAPSMPDHADAPDRAAFVAQTLALFERSLQPESQATEE